MRQRCIHASFYLHLLEQPIIGRAGVARSSEFGSRRLTGAKQMQRKAAKLQAQRLIEEFGPAAYEQALAAERVARRKQDKRLANFLAEVVR